MHTGQHTTLQCIVDGDLPLHISWKFNGREMSSSTSVSFVNGRRINVLTIEPINAKHAGNYTCEAWNTAGISNHTTHLAVNGLSLHNMC